MHPRSSTRLTSPQPVLLGVASALAKRFHLEPIVVRLAFVTFAVAGGWGVVLYGALWLLWSRDTPVVEPSAPPERPVTTRTVGVILVMVGTLLLLRGRLPGALDQVVWPIALVSSGLMLAWDQLIPATPTAPELTNRRYAALRVGGGLVLLIAGLGFLLATNMSMDAARDAIVASVVVVAGLFLMLGPWVIRLVYVAGDERDLRIRADERAELAAHLHDSVLQTLTLMQKQAADPEAMAMLARRQERELRRWLYGPGQDDHDTPTGFVNELDAMVAGVEDQHRIRIDAVTVGDTTIDPALQSTVAAAKEALVNAARFSDERQISLYAQVDDEAAEVFVRDRGRGFDRSVVPDDRHGIRQSIEGRMRRAGGHAEVKSEPGAGTEVHLHLPRGVVRSGQ
jgi:signal transduction histidine kinase